MLLLTSVQLSGNSSSVLLLLFFDKKKKPFLTLVCLIDILNIDVLEVIILYSIHDIDKMTKGYFNYDELFIVLS